jgi:hypothetical protein
VQGKTANLVRRALEQNKALQLPRSIVLKGAFLWTLFNLKTKEDSEFLIEMKLIGLYRL